MPRHTRGLYGGWPLNRSGTAPCKMKGAIDDSQPDARAVGAMAVSPALQRGESFHIETGPESRRQVAQAPPLTSLSKEAKT